MCLLQLAVDLAGRFNGEIVNADAMQLYRGLPIVTNKISLEEQRSIPHHLLGDIDLDQDTWVVSVFKKEATHIIQEIRGRGRLPIVVGGTHYYVHALLFEDSLVKAKDEDAKLAALPSDTRYPILDDSTEAILKRLKEVDPVMADKWHPNDRRKISRSLEIFLQTGRRASDIYAEQEEKKNMQVVSEAETEARPDPLLFWVHSDYQVLKDRLNRRVDKMLEIGLMDEIEEMNQYLRSRRQAGETVDLSRGIWQSIGFKEFQPYLQAREDALSDAEVKQSKLECLEAMKTATRRYAKYQNKWISKRTMPLLNEQGALDRLYVLDSTDVAKYAEQVTAQAAALTQQFVAGEEMPKPSEISAAARDALSAAKDFATASQQTPCRKHCEICNTTLITEESWKKHINGRSHRRCVRRAKRTALVPVEEAKTAVIVHTSGSEPK